MTNRTRLLLIALPIVLLVVIGMRSLDSSPIGPGTVPTPGSVELPRATAVAQGAAPTVIPPTPTPIPTAIPTPRPQPRITVQADASPLTVTFSLDAFVPAGAAEATLWYDAPDGRALRRILLGGDEQVRAAITITPAETGLTTTIPLSGALDFWWAVRDRSGELLRESGTITLPAELAALQQTEPISAPQPLEWVERATPHVRLLVSPGSPAEHDLERIAAAAETAYTQASTWITPTESVSVTIYLIPRVFWQGGVAYGNELLIISYPDRNYIGVALESYLVHEITHALAAAWLPNGVEVGGLLGEGIAVLTVGGHYGAEPIDAWAATLAQSDRYVPLCELRHDFYSAQHEVAYLQGASFTSYLLRTYGREIFLELYRNQTPQRGQGAVEEICAADARETIAPIGKSYVELERDWLDYLATIVPSDAERRAWALQYDFFELMRRYQTERDPDARILPPPPPTWDAPTAAIFLNPAAVSQTTVLETMLAGILPAIQRGDTGRAAELLNAVEQALDTGSLDAPITRDYAAIVATTAALERALRLGDADALPAAPALLERLPFSTDDLLFDLRMNPLQIDITGDRAEAMLRIDGSAFYGDRLDRKLFQANFLHNRDQWQLTDISILP